MFVLGVIERHFTPPPSLSRVMHVYAISAAIATAAMVLALGALYLCYDSWGENVATFASLADVPWDDTSRWADGLERMRIKTISTHKLSFFALCCMLLATLFTLTITVRLCEDKESIYRRRGDTVKK